MTNAPYTAATLLSKVIVPTLTAIDLDSSAARTILLGTCAQESRMGEYRRQIGGGPALGIFQVEPATAADTWDNYIMFRPALRKAVGILLGDGDRIAALEHNDIYSCAIARIIYRRAPTPLPDSNDLDAQAAYYVRWYNRGGKATVKEYAANWAALGDVNVRIV